MCVNSVSFDSIYRFKINKYISTIYNITVKNTIYPTDYVTALIYSLYQHLKMYHNPDNLRQKKGRSP